MQECPARSPQRQGARRALLSENLGCQKTWLDRQATLFS
jgi:hypothetical protein